MRTTSNGVDSRGVQFELLGNPVPAPRPRVRVHNGVGYAYYAGKYKTYLAEAPKAIPESPRFFEKGTSVQVCIHFHMKRPQKPANPYPVGDIDNYCKSILDAITKNGTYWKDDTQVTALQAYKTYTTGAPRTCVYILPLDDS